MKTRRTAALKEALVAGDAPLVQREAHTIKGASANLGARVLCEVVRQMEKAGKDNHLDLAPDLIRALDAEYDNLAQELTALPTSEPVDF